MFWGAFLYNWKAPCHIWRPETAAEKEALKRELKAINDVIEPKLRQAQGLNTGIQRLGLCNKPDRKPQFCIIEENGAFQKNGKKGGINWYCYLTMILLPILIPFGIECQINCLDTIIQEDKAPAYTSHYQQIYFNTACLQYLIQPGNSPDLNIIEPAQLYLKQVTTKKGVLRTRAEAEQAQRKAQKELKQWQIQAQIERIPKYIKEVICCEGGNNYIKGATDSTRDWKAFKRIAQYQSNIIAYIQQQVLLGLN